MPSVRITKQKENTVTTFLPLCMGTLCVPRIQSVDSEKCGQEPVLLWGVVRGKHFVQKEGKDEDWLVWFLVSLAILSSQNIIRVFKLLLLEASASLSLGNVYFLHP